MKKRRVMRLVACIMTLCLVWTTCLPGVRAARTGSATDRYDKDYNISTILSRFQYFVSQNATMGSGAHTVGAIMVGKKLDLGNWFGDVAIFPSYIGELGKIGGFRSSSWVDEDDWYNIIYYGDGNPTTALTDPNAGNWIKNKDYINVDEAFKAIQIESDKLASTSNSELITTGTDGVVTIDCTGDNDVYVVLDYTTFNANNINLNVVNVDWFQNHVCCVSVIGVNGSDVTFNCNDNIQLNGNGIINKLKDMSGSKEGGQFNLEGMNLVWNFPDATGMINTTNLSGHMVAPQATVDTGSSNYEGGIIAKNLQGESEGHFYPMSKTLKTTGTSSGNGSGNTEGQSPEDSGSTGSGTGSEGTTPGGSTTPGGNTGATTPGTGNTETTPGGNTGTTTPGTSTTTPSTETGDLEIVVQDEKTGDPVPNAKVVITYPDGSREEATTDANGTITKKGRTPGEYTVTVTEVPDGYTVTTGQEDKVTVVAGQTTRHVVKINSEGVANADDEDDEDDIDDEDDTEDGEEAEAASRNAAKTGDSFPVAVPVVLLIGAAATMLILGYSKKRYE